MQIKSLMLAVALAVSGAAMAAAPNDTAKAPADTSTTTTTTRATTTASGDTTLDEKMQAGAHKTKRAAKKVHAKAKRAAHRAHAKASRAGHEMNAKAHHGMDHGTHAMGASAAPSTDMNASSRQARMDQAYANWKARYGS